jgi:hypothetical protein
MVSPRRDSRWARALLLPSEPDKADTYGYDACAVVDHRAQDLATEALVSLTVGAADTDEQASRRRRLLKGPEEFREARVDRPKAKGR